MALARELAKAVGLLALIVAGVWLAIEVLWWWGMASGVPTVP